jgi:hypothetical protein
MTERRSKSAEEARRQALERERSMTPRERMLLALELGERDRLVQALLAPRGDAPGPRG